MCTVSETRTAGRRRAEPVTTQLLPVVRCLLCGRPMVHQRKKGAAAAVLTEHYNAEHTAEELAGL